MAVFEYMLAKHVCIVRMCKTYKASLFSQKSERRLNLLYKAYTYVRLIRIRHIYFFMLSARHTVTQKVVQMFLFFKGRRQYIIVLP